MAWRNISEEKAKQLGIEKEYMKLQNTMSPEEVAKKQQPSNTEKKESRNHRAEASKDNKIIIPGRPITKKNSQVITKRKNGKPGLIQSPQYREYEKECLWFLKQYQGPTYQDTKLHVACKYWMPNKRSWPDLVGLMQATWDILEKAGIIDDDQNIVNPDGTRIMGIDEELPRVEVRIREEEDEMP